ncbi:MAG: cupin domain-containing protein [Acidimicrobiia bacterium]|nr:cupin domain-containing protein [Acidimicrobiia bacterium]
MTSSGELRGTVFADVTDNVEIPEQGTLSRVLYRDDQVRVVLFAFDRDQELTDHSADRPALIQVLSGRLEVKLGSDSSTIDSKSWVHMPARLNHAVRALEPSIMVLTLFST